MISSLSYRLATVLIDDYGRHTVLKIDRLQVVPTSRDDLEMQPGSRKCSGTVGKRGRSLTGVTIARRHGGPNRARPRVPPHDDARGRGPRAPQRHPEERPAGIR